jgi:uncharacterized protein (AIM24 family)
VRAVARLGWYGGEIAMKCSRCGSLAPAGARFCQVCGAPLDPANAAAGGAGVTGDLHPDAIHPLNSIRVGDLLVTVEGELVPVANVELGIDQTIYFEHHTLLWKQPEVKISFRSQKGTARRFFAGVPVFLSEARGPGNIAVCRESVGHIVALPLGPGDRIDVREHQFLLATSNIDYTFVSISGVATALFTRTGSRTGLLLDRFTGGSESGIVLLHGYGNVFEKLLAPGEVLDVEPGAWLWKDATVHMGVTSVLGSGHGGLVGALSNVMSGISVAMNRFTGPGRIGIQSMTYTPYELRETGERTGPAGGVYGASSGSLPGL